MGVARRLEGAHKDLILLTEQGKVVGFLASTQNAQRINGLVEDIREAIMDYQVCVSDCSLLPHLTPVLDFIATGYL